MWLLLSSRGFPYQALDRPSKFVQLGTVIEGRDEFYTSRLNRKERRGNLVIAHLLNRLSTFMFPLFSLLPWGV